MDSAPSPRGVLAISLQLTGMALCPLALAYGFADNGPVQWALLTVGVVVFYAGWSLQQGRAPDP